MLPKLLKRVRARGQGSFREATGGLRMLPELLVIGAQKSGTTSLYQYLTEHRQVLPGTVKEVRYFNAKYDRGLNWYRSHFPLASGYASDKPGARPITLDASTGYLYAAEAPGRVAADLPGAKFVVLLRDPIERAWSHYSHSLREGHESLSFAEALAAEEARLVQSREAFSRGEPDDRAGSFHSYKARGRYHEQLERWFAVFDRERFLILKSEEFFAAPAKATNEVLAFLGLGPVALSDPPVHNAGSTEEIPEEARVSLRDYFKPYNERLYELLDWEPAWN